MNFKKDIKTLEKVQRRGTKMIPELKDLDYEDRLKRLKLPSLVYRRFRGDMIQTYKYMHGYYAVDLLMTLEKHKKTRSHALKIHKSNLKKIVRQRFLISGFLKSWNSLPKDITEATSLNVFKNQLD